MALIGYARVSTDDQNLDLQRVALQEAGCERIFEDHGVSAVAKTRPGFEEALRTLEAGDTLVIWKMDRAFRSLKNALDTLDALDGTGVEFRSLTDHIDTTTPMGKCMYQVRNAFAELERSLISERTKAGLAAARRKGKRLGRPRKLSPADVARARELLAADEQSAASIAALLGVSRRTLNRAMFSRLNLESLIGQ